MSWSEYNGDPVHDMYVDGYYANCESDSYGGYNYPVYYGPITPKPRRRTPIQKCKREIGRLKDSITRNEQRIIALEAELATMKEGSKSYRKTLNRLTFAKTRLEIDTKKMEEQSAKLARFKADYRHRLIIGIIIASICIPIILLCIIASL